MKAILVMTAMLLAMMAQKEALADAVQNDHQNKVNSEGVIVQGKPWLINPETRYAHSLPEVDGTVITVTKKASVVQLDHQPTVINNNQREMFNRLPGVIIAEQQDPTQLNLTYRGIGNPQESEYVLVLQDGMPIALDWFGYPAHYYLPIPQTIDSIQMIRGGSGLLYGPEPQPVINYVSRAPDPSHMLTGMTEQVMGADGLFSSYNEITGTRGALGYLADFSRRQSDGMRENGDFTLNSGDLRLKYAVGEHQGLRLDVLAYSLDSGLPGFLTVRQFNADPDMTTTPADHLWTDRFSGALRYDNQFSGNDLLTVKLWAGKTEVAHRSDSYSGDTPTAASINEQTFHFGGLDARLAHRWGRGNALTVGTTLYRSSSDWGVVDNLQPYTRRDDRSGTISYDNHSTTKYGALFAENVFRFGKFHIVPSARLEREEIGTNEKIAASPPHTGPLVHDTLSRDVALFGLGLGNDFGHGNETYLNIAQGYRPVRYRDVASNRSRLNAGNDPDTTEYLTFEAGIHGWPQAGLFYDVSVFVVQTNNRIESQSDGLGGSVNVNSGDARSRGVEMELDYDLLRISANAPADRHLDFFVNASLLDAQITDSITLENSADPMGSTLAGNTPAYAPDYVIKAGLTWRQQDHWKASLVGQSIGTQFWADSNQPRIAGDVIVMPARIPSYTVFDLSADYLIAQHLRLLGGVSNLTNEHYYSRVFFVNGGIEPAPGRNFHLGAAYDF